MADVKLSELEQLNLDEARERAAQRVNARTQRANRMRALERSMTDNEARQRDIQSRCAHKKGGKGVGGLYSGNDANYAIIKHTLSHGPTICICQRCRRKWEPPNKALIAKGTATPETRALYRSQAEDYNWAMNAPTDNEPSGSALFAFSSEEAA